MIYHMFHSERDYALPWIKFETNQKIVDYVYDWARQEFCLYDFDECGIETIQFVIVDENFENKLFIEIEHEWYMELSKYYEDEKIINDFAYKLIDHIDFEYPKINRDWMKL
jgi:hypothetical protein